jgi:hypothetical protein
MMKQSLLASLAIFVAWGLLDFFFHGVLLMGDYTATASLWRPMDQMNPILMHGATFVGAVLLTWIYGAFISNKSVSKGFKFGASLGLLMGVVAGFAPYAWMPITLKIAEVWALAYVFKYAVAGAIMGKIMTKDC